MIRHLLLIATAGALSASAQAAFAHGPPPGVGHGPPAWVSMGPPAAVTMGPPGHVMANVPTGAAGAANELGKLNAMHASPVALQHAAPNSAVGAIATYRSQMNDALALTDPMARDDAITAARQQLASTSNKQLTPSAITKVDAQLGITGAPPDLGTTP